MKLLQALAAAALSIVFLLSAGCATGPSILDAHEEASEEVAISGTITAIDAATRMITLRGEEGNELVVQASEDVRNFAQMAVGDIVTVMYIRSVAFDLQPAGSGEAGAYIEDDVVRADEGQMPGAAAGERVTILAPIVAIDRASNTVSVRGPRGNVQPIHVFKPEYQKQLGKLKVGDLLRITYTEAVAVSVSKGP